MKAIQVKFLAPTNFKPARVKAWAEGGHSLVVAYQYELSGMQANAELIAQELIYNRGWHNDGVVISGSGQLPNGDYVFTLKGK
jgi:hypothetical protein